MKTPRLRISWLMYAVALLTQPQFGLAVLSRRYRVVVMLREDDAPLPIIPTEAP